MRGRKGRRTLKTLSPFRLITRFFSCPNPTLFSSPQTLIQKTAGTFGGALSINRRLPPDTPPGSLSLEENKMGEDGTLCKFSQQLILPQQVIETAALSSFWLLVALMGYSNTSRLSRLAELQQRQAEHHFGTQKYLFSDGHLPEPSSG